MRASTSVFFLEISFDSTFLALAGYSNFLITRYLNGNHASLDPLIAKTRMHGDSAPIGRSTCI